MTGIQTVSCTTFLQSLQTSLIWKSCADLPHTSSCGSATVINSSVYFTASHCHDPRVVYCYDPSQDTWTALPLLPVGLFGLGQIDGKLIAVGGAIRNRNSISNKLYTYDEVSHKWKQTFPPMPTARRSPSVLSLQSALVTVGGIEEDDVFTNVVEILKLDTLKWCKAAPVPVACENISLVAIDNTCYAIGGSYGVMEATIFFKQALYVSINDLLLNTIAADEAFSSEAKPIWKSLPDTPRYIPTATKLAGRLLSVGGGNQPKGGDDMKEVYMYSDTTKCWVYICDLPAPRANTAIVALSATEILVIGGYDQGRVNTVHKGTLQIEL